MASNAIAYLSTAINRAVTAKEIDDLLADARVFNQSIGVTGVLLYCDGNFFQYLEGSPESVAVVYKRILKSSLHIAVIELFNASVERTHFSNWAMGFAAVAQSDLQQISHASWAEQHDKISRQSEMNPGIALLLSYWDRHCRL